MRRRVRISMLTCAAFLLAGFGAAESAIAQGVTAATIIGQVSDGLGNPLADAGVVAVHEPSETRYGGLTRADGPFTIPGMRVGGP